MSVILISPEVCSCLLFQVATGRLHSASEAWQTWIVNPSILRGMCAKSKIGATYKIPGGAGSIGLSLSVGGLVKHSQLDGPAPPSIASTARSSPLAKLVHPTSEIIDKI